MSNSSFAQILFNSGVCVCIMYDYLQCPKQFIFLDIISEILFSNLIAKLVLKMICYWFAIWKPCYTFIHSNSLIISYHWLYMQLFMSSGNEEHCSLLSSLIIHIFVYLIFSYFVDNTSVEWVQVVTTSSLASWLFCFVFKSEAFSFFFIFEISCLYSMTYGFICSLFPCSTSP